MNTFSQPELPNELRGWNWGAFFFTWIWGIGNNVLIALLALVPGIHLIMMIVLGVKGNEWAWQNKRWDSVDHFKRVQHRWAVVGVVLFVIGIALSIAMIATIPFLLKHQNSEFLFKWQYPTLPAGLKEAFHLENIRAGWQKIA